MVSRSLNFKTRLPMVDTLLPVLPSTEVDCASRRRGQRAEAPSGRYPESTA